MNMMNNIIKMINICTLADLHLNVGNTVSNIRTMVQPCDLVVYVGDILNFEFIPDCGEWGSECNQALTYLDTVIDDIGKDFLFTLGNHDTVPVHTSDISQHIAQHPLHVGICNPTASACYHRHPNIATLYSGSYGCPYATNSLNGCPLPEDAKFIDEHLDHIHMLFTHIPPPQAFGLPFTGIQTVCNCGWGPTNISVLPSVPTDWHGSGHYHNSLFTTNSSPKYINLMKSGPNAYGPCFSNNVGGMNVFNWDQSHVTFDRHELVNGHIPDFDASACNHVIQGTEPDVIEGTGVATALTLTTSVTIFSLLVSLIIQW